MVVTCISWLFFNHRGLLALQTLHKLQDLTGKPVHQLFDYICGVSTGSVSPLCSVAVLFMEHVILNRNPLCPFGLGAILAFMLGIYQIPLEECEEMYRKLGSDVFKQNVIVGTMKMGWSHAFYDSEIWENVLKLVISFISFVVKIIRRNFSSPLYCSLILYFCLFVKGTHGRRLYDRECQGPTLPQSKLQPCFFFIVTYCFSHFNLINFSGSGNRHKPLFDSVDQKFQLI